ncbi:MAG: hypothetical protein M0Q87_14785 [Ottowia sp.]|nr:hypothetical protein [Ottowia sp.]
MMNHGGAAAVIEAAQRRGHTKRQRGHPSSVIRHPSCATPNAQRSTQIMAAQIHAIVGVEPAPGLVR